MTPEQLAVWVTRSAEALTLFAAQYCLAAEDVVQDAFVKLSLARPEPTDPLAWLYRVVRNAAISQARKERRRGRHETAAARRDSGLSPAEFESADLSAALDALGRLPLPLREVIVAHLWGELSFEAVGQLLGCSASTAFRHYQAGLSAIRESLRLPCPKSNLT